MFEGLLEGKIAMVTGGGRGIGESAVRMLSQAGAAVIIADIDTETAGAVANDLASQGRKAQALALNVADFEALPSKVAKAAEIFGGIDILVNVAGITAANPITEITTSGWDRIMDIDLKAMFFLTQEVFKLMKEQGRGGKLVHLSSLAAQRGGRSSDASYAAAKAGILNLSKCFALAGAEFGIYSNAICPGNILTPMGKSLSWSQKDPKTYIPIGRYGTPEDIAYAVLFYSSCMSDYITGDDMKINGGLYI